MTPALWIAGYILAALIAGRIMHLTGAFRAERTGQSDPAGLLCGMIAWPMMAVGGAAYVAVCAALKLITLPTRAERQQRRQAEADRIQAEIRADAERLGLPLVEDDRE